MYNKQMEMFQDGGLKDQGNTTDPVSGNDVPSGSLKEEVRDDIDAKLSPGEFVFPADVVRFIGLEKLMMIRDKAKKGLSRMEEMGQMGNSDEATIDDDVPFGMEDLIIVSGGPDVKMNEGGMADYGNRFDQLVGQPMFESVTKVFENERGQKLFIPFVRGQPVYQPPEGYREVTERDLQTEVRDPTAATRNIPVADGQMDQTVPGDPINTNIDSQGNILPQEAAGGEMRGTAGTEKSMDEMSVAEQVAAGSFAIDNPGIAQFGANLGDFAERAMVDGFIGGAAPGPIGGAIARGVRSDEFQDMFNVSAPSFPDALPGSYAEATGIPNKPGTYSRDADVGKGTYAGRPGGKGTRDRDRAVDMALSDRGVISPSVVNNARKAAEISQANRLGITAPDFAMNVSMDLMSAHAENVSRGNAAPGSRANALGGSTTFSKPGVTDYSFSTNAYNEVVDNKTHKQQQAKISQDDKNREKQTQREAKEAKEKAEKERQNELRGMGSFGGVAAPSDPSIGAAADPAGNPSGGGSEAPGVSTPGGGPDSEADTDTSETADDDSGAGVEGSKGGFIPKRKKQKKMKRGGLASRK